MESENLNEDLWKDFTNSLNLNQLSEDKMCLPNCKKCDANQDTFSVFQGDLTCVNCGLIAECSMISNEPEWNNYVEDGVMSSAGIRCGTILDPTNPYDSATGFVPKFMWSWHLDENGIKRYTNLSKLAIRVNYSSKQRAFDEGKYSFEKIQERLHLSESIFNTAKLFWGIILKTDILRRGGNRRGMKACCIFYACLSQKQQRNREDIADAFDINNTTDFTKGEKIFREIFSKNNDYSWVLYKGSENESMYQRYVIQFGLPYTITKTMIIIKDHTRDHLLGIAAKSEIAGLLFYACKEVNGLKHPNKSEIAKCIGICNPTLNKVIEIIRYFYDKNPDLKLKL